MKRTESNTVRQDVVGRIETALARIAQGGIVLVRDDEGRENEGDLVAAAELATAETVNTMVRDGRGLVCQSISAETARRLNLPLQAPGEGDAQGTAFTVSVDAARNATTGISAQDRAEAVRILCDPSTGPEDLRRPGHLFPLIARPGGVLERPGHTEASLDLARLAGLTPSGLICEVLSEDGTMARGPELEALAERWDMPIVSVADLIEYRYRVGDVGLEASPGARLPTAFGAFRATVYRSDDPTCREAVLLEAVNADAPSESAAQLVRVHSECLTGEAFHSSRCDCGPQLDHAMERVAVEGGAIVYLRQEGRGIGLFDKMRAYALQDDGLDTLDANVVLGRGADERRYGVAAAILRRHGYRRVRLMTNNPAKQSALEDGGVTVAAREPVYVGATDENRGYLRTKIERMGHIAPQEETP